MHTQNLWVPQDIVTIFQRPRMSTDNWLDVMQSAAINKSGGGTYSRIYRHTIYVSPRWEPYEYSKEPNAIGGINQHKAMGKRRRQAPN